jgi:hypothetical protein
VDVFLDERRKWYLETYLKVDSHAKVEKHRWDVKAGWMEVEVVRGEVFEKAAYALSNLTTREKEAPYVPANTFIRHLEAMIFPRNPRAPMAAIHLVFGESLTCDKSKNIANIFLDLFPQVSVKEDLDFFQNEMRAISEKYGMNYGTLRAKTLGVYQDLAAHVGLMHTVIGVNENEYEFIKESSKVAFLTEMEIIKKRCHEKAAENEYEQMNRARMKLLDYMYLKDPVIKSYCTEFSIPLEAIASYAFPPSVKF